MPDNLTIAHLSDIHIGSRHFLPNLLERAIAEINELEPDAVIISGDLTDEGFRQQYKSAQTYLASIKCPNVLVVPGNHDSRNVGYVHFEELLGPRHKILHLPGLTIVGVDSSEPDIDSGRIGREQYGWLEEAFSDDCFKIFALHHHLLPVPGTGRERNVVSDAGDVLEVLLRLGVDIVVTGHKHVPYAWMLENLFVINAGTVASLRLRGRTKPCYNVIQMESSRARVYRKYPFGGSELIVDFSLHDRQYCRWTEEIGAEIGEATEH